MSRRHDLLIRSLICRSRRRGRRPFAWLWTPLCSGVEADPSECPLLPPNSRPAMCLLCVCRRAGSCDATGIPLQERIILGHFSHFLLHDVSCFFSGSREESHVMRIKNGFRGFHTFSSTHSSSDALTSLTRSARGSGDWR